MVLAMAKLGCMFDSNMFDKSVLEHYVASLNIGNLGDVRILTSACC